MYCISVKVKFNTNELQTLKSGPVFLVHSVEYLIVFILCSENLTSFALILTVHKFVSESLLMVLDVHCEPLKKVAVHL